MINLKKVFKAYSPADYRAWVDEKNWRVCIFPKLKASLWKEFWQFAAAKGWTAADLTVHHKRYFVGGKLQQILYPKYFWKPIEWFAN